MKQQLASLVLVVATIAGCTHHADPARELRSAVSPFTQTRDRAVQLVGSTKHALGASDLNTLAVTYTALEEKGNAYAGFLVGAVSDASFSDAKNEENAGNLAAAIKTFNSSFASIAPQNQRAAIDNAWIPPFAAAVSGYWSKYHAALTDMSPQAKADLIKQLKGDTVWPNYEDIATEPVAAPSPH
jgi:hypothetical protein